MRHQRGRVVLRVRFDPRPSSSRELRSRARHEPADIVQEFEAGFARMREAYSGAFESAKSEHELREQNARFLGPVGRAHAADEAHARGARATRRRSSASAPTRSRPRSSSAFARAARASSRARCVRPSCPGRMLDVSLPGATSRVGRLHPMTQVTYRAARCVRVDGLRRRRRARDRPARAQLRQARLPAGSSGDRHAGQLLHLARRRA